MWNRGHVGNRAHGYDLIEAFGENPEGFRQSKTCKGLRLTDGECDSMHIFWNHETKHIDWWRL